jgi:hypothetical protein
MRRVDEFAQEKINKYHLKMFSKSVGKLSKRDNEGLNSGSEEKTKEFTRLSLENANFPFKMLPLRKKKISDENDVRKCLVRFSSEGKEPKKD